MHQAVRSPPSAPPPQAQDGLPKPRRYWSVLTIWLGLMMAVLDGSIANVALPTIARELHATPAASVWIINAYQLAITVCLLPLAALGETLGHRRVYLTGLALFTAGSLACALSHTLPTLAAARVLQGVGAAGLMSLNAALLRFTYPKRLLGRGIGLNAVVISISGALGPSVASAILSQASWEWLFAVNVPVGAAAVFVGLRALPRTDPSGRPFDWLSALLNALAFGLLIFGAERAARETFSHGALQLAAGAVAAILLVRRELGRAAPLVPVDLLRIPLFGLSAATSVASFTAQMLAFVALPFEFQGALGRSAVATGLLMTPWPLAAGLAAPVAARLAERRPVGLLGGVGLGVLACGLAALTMLGAHASTAQIVWRMALCGLGFGFFQSPNNRALVSSAPLHRSGAAGGMLATARLLGQTAGALGTAVLFQLSGPRATVLALGLGATVAAAAAVISLLRLRLDAAQPAQA